MKIIDDLIPRYDHPMADEIELHTQAKLKMIKALLAEIKGSKDCAYMEEIIAQFVELLEDMQDTIDSQMVEIAKADGYGPMNHNFVSGSKLTSDDIPWDPEEEPGNEQIKELPPFLPQEGGFKTDDQVKKAFTNYLTYHVERKTKAGKDKPFSVHTVYDYSSRIKVLMEIVCEEWLACNRDSLIQLSEQTVQAGCPFLNAYNNIGALKQYVERKERELHEVSMGLIEAAPDSQKNPLNNIRNLKNTIAALAKFDDFRNAVINQLQ
jgi:hypothetical protein